LSQLPEYETQKRIVWQGKIWIENESGGMAGWAIFFGYDRNHDYAVNGAFLPCKGVDLIEFKRVLPKGHWAYDSFLILSDDNYDCHADRGWLDCDQDGIPEPLSGLPSEPIVLEKINGEQIRHLYRLCP